MDRGGGGHTYTCKQPLWAKLSVTGTYTRCRVHQYNVAQRGHNMRKNRERERERVIGLNFSNSTERASPQENYNLIIKNIEKKE